MDQIDDKINELIEIAQKNEDTNTVIVLLILRAARLAGLDLMFATKVQEYAKDVLLPETIRKRDCENASLN
jgi:hypothetical protein